MEKERDEVKEEAQLARLAIEELVEDKLAKAQDALAVVEEAKWKVEAEAARLEVE